MCSDKHAGGVGEHSVFHALFLQNLLISVVPNRVAVFWHRNRGPISGQGCQPGDSRLAVGGGLCGGEAVAEKWTAISGSFF